MPRRQKPAQGETWVHCQRLLRMVRELHKRGYEGLRVHAGLSASGVHWCCSIHVAYAAGAGLPGLEEAGYSSASANRYFRWSDAAQDDAPALADKFERRFPVLCRAASQRGAAYCAWYEELLGWVNAGYLPIAYADYPLGLRRDEVLLVNVDDRAAPSRVIAAPPQG